MDALNLQLYHWIAGGHAPHRALLWLAMHVADGAAWLCVALIAWAAWRHPAERIYLVAVCLLAAAAGMLAHMLAAQWNQPRPFMLGLSPSWLDHGGRGSLPSTHASVMFTVALCFLWRVRLRGVGWLLAGFALLTGWARVYVGVHFPLDIAAGLLLAMLLAALFVGADALVRRSARTQVRLRIRRARRGSPARGQIA